MSPRVLIALETRTCSPAAGSLQEACHSTQAASPARWSILARTHALPSICTSTPEILAGPPQAAPAILYSNRSPTARRVTRATTDFKLFLDIELSSQTVPSGDFTARR